MPQVQVLNRTADPVAQQMSQFGSDMAGILQKKQELAQNKSKLDIAIKQLDFDAKNTDNLNNQNKLAAQKQFLEYAKFLEEKQISPELKMPALKKVAESLGLDLFADGLAPLGQAMSMGEDIEGKAKKESKGNVSGMLEAMQDVDGWGGAGEAGGAQGSMLPTSINVGGMTMENPQAKAQLAAMETTARERAKVSEEIRPIKASIDAYTTQFGRAIGEMGGLGTTALGAWSKGSYKAAEAKVGSLPEIQAFEQLKGPVSLQFAAFLNRGRPTEPDRQAAEKVLENIRYPKRTNEALQRFREAMLSSYVTGSIGQGNEYVKGMGRYLVDKAESFVKEAQKNGLSEEAINQVLDEYYQTLGY